MMEWSTEGIYLVLHAHGEQVRLYRHGTRWEPRSRFEIEGLSLPAYFESLKDAVEFLEKNMDHLVGIEGTLRGLGVRKRPWWKF